MLSQTGKRVNHARPVGAPEFRFLGRSLCLDFVNTVGFRGRTPNQDKLLRFADLVRWSELAGILRHSTAVRLLDLAAEQPRAAHSLLARAIRLREALHCIFKAVIEGRNPLQADLQTLNREIATARAHQRLTHPGNGFIWRWDKDGALDRMLWPVAIAAAELLISEKLVLLRQCADEECRWMFLDTSRNRSRHWCDMRDCGNRAKVAQFRRRLRA